MKTRSIDHLGNYFDVLFQGLDENNPDIKNAFGKHVHWGYWVNPKNAKGTSFAYGQAAEAMTRKVLNAGHLNNGMSVLDTGCGFGGTISTINENYNHMKLTGLNIDSRQLNRARNTINPLNSNSINFVQGNACHMPFEDQQFDAVFAVECIFHFPSREQFFKEAKRVLKPGGILVVSDILGQILFGPIIKKLNQYLPFHDMIKTFGSIDTSYTVKSYSKLSQKTGLPLTKIQNINKNTLPTYPFLRSLFKDVDAKFYPKAYIKVLRTFEGLARSGLTQYTILAFQKS